MSQTWDKPFPVVVRDSLLTPLGMNHSTFDRAEVHARTDRAAGLPAPVRRRRGQDRPAPPAGRLGRVVTTAVTTAGAPTTFVTVAAIQRMPGLVDVGFLGRMAFPLPLRVALHLADRGDPGRRTRRAPGGRRGPALVALADPATGTPPSPSP